MSYSSSSSDAGDHLPPSGSDPLLHSSEDIVEGATEASRSSSPSPPTPGLHARLLPHADDPAPRSSPVSSASASRSLSLSQSFVPSPLNPNFPAHGAAAPRARRASKASVNALGTVHRVASEDVQALALGADSRRGSMVLYRLASSPFDAGELPLPGLPPPPGFAPDVRRSFASSSGSSVLSLSYDSKYPSSAVSSSRGFVPYAYDPETDCKHAGPEDDDYLYGAEFGEAAGRGCGCGSGLNWRGTLNIAMLVAVTLALLALFICYPIVTFYKNGTLERIAGNSHINSTGQYDLAVQARRYPFPFIEDGGAPP